AAPQDPPNSSAGSVFRGTVRDSAGAAVANVRVDAIAGGGLKPFELGSTTTDRDGAFRLALERGKLTGMARQARLRVREGPLQLFESEDYSLPRAADAEPVALVLPAGAGTEATRFTLRVGVHDAAGAPIAGAEVRLHPAAPEPVRPDHGGEVEARTDAAGEVVLRGRVPGPKRLWVDARAQGGATSLTDCEVERASDTRLEIRMPEPATLRGTVTALAGPLPEHLSVWLEDRNACLHRGELGARGEVEFRGLLAVPHTLHVRGWPISPVERAGLVPGAAAFRVELKRNDDPRDVGDHMAELHGRVVDAATGETLPLGGFEIHVHRREFAGDSTLAADGCPPPQPVQTAAGVGTVEQFHETGLAAGRWVLTADVSGYAASAREFTLADGELVADLEIALQRGATLSGRVLDDRGAPVKSALVCLLGVGELPDRLLAALRQPTGERRSWPCVNLCAARSRPDGTFELTGVPPDLALRVVAWKADLGLCAQAPNVYRAGAEVSGLELRLQRR
ncbi:MAG: carboxypeptidase regulatory-like domain-containing protein, partial [Planctomycetes bacterium]|nr:carboxypeptidase regulatory-like domain-containing protein [Planctomycetota bacterium]